MADDITIIYTYLVNTCQFTRQGAAAMLGVWQLISSNNKDKCEGDSLKDFPGEDKLFENLPSSMDAYCNSVLFPYYATNKVYINKSSYLNSGKYWPGLGIGQWKGSDAVALLDWATKHNSRWNTLGCQLSFAQQEFLTSYKKVGDMCKLTNDLKQAVTYICKYYHGYKYTSSSMNLAKSMYNTFGTAKLDDSILVGLTPGDTQSKVWPVDQKYRISYQTTEKIDVQCPPGTSVKAWRGGTVTQVSNNQSSYGGYVKVQHENGLSSFYGHLTPYSQTVKIGDYLTAGDIIGTSGQSGNTNVPLLSFGILDNNKPSNALTWVQPGDEMIVPVPGMSNRNPRDIIDPGKIRSRIIVIEPHVPGNEIPFDMIKGIGSIGVMIYSGAYYNEAHMVRYNYRGENLHDQAVYATMKGVHWGLYHVVRARSVDEAKLELEQLYYTVTNYPPAYGVWLKLDLQADNDTNNNILWVYYMYLSKWGFGKSCGIYCGDEQLAKINWNDLQDYFFLWYINPIESLDYGKVYEILDPSFFSIGAE